MAQKIGLAQSLKYFNKNLFCSQVIAIHFETKFASKRQRSPDGFASFFQIRSYFTATFLLSSTALQTFLCTSWRWRKVKRSTTFLSGQITIFAFEVQAGSFPQPHKFTSPKRVPYHCCFSYFLGKLFDSFVFPMAFHIWPLHTAGFLCLKRSEGYITISGDQAAGWSL